MAINSIYLDNNSTTAIHPEVVEVMTKCLHERYLNPASQHASGRRARRVLEQAKEQISSMLGASIVAPEQDSVIITSGGTESNNLAIRGLVRKPGEILISEIEHPSALAAADELKAIGCTIRPIPVDQDGCVTAKTVGDMISHRTRLVCVMLGNNETGVLQPVEELAKICSSTNIPLHTDAVQVVGKLSVNFRKLGVSAMSISAHKFQGPRGVGALLVRSRTDLKPLLVGGSQQLGLRPGSESVVNIVGMAKAIELSISEAEERTSRLTSLRDQLQETLLAGCNCVVNGSENRLPHTLNLSFPGLDRQAIVMALDLAGIECSTGSACTSGSSEPSHVLLAMGLGSERVESSIRLSLSAFSTRAEITEAGSRILAVIARLQR